MNRRKDVGKPKIYRQSFLTFPTIPRPAGRTQQPLIARAPRPAPALPAEIWIRILEDLSTISLKATRLVCRAWSEAAIPQLFRVAYLDGFENSWTRLQQLSNSPYASLVHTITWSPLYLPEKCLDAEVWRSRYVNLLKDLSHAEYADIHGAFKSVFRQEAGKTSNKKLFSRHYASMNLPAFVNCRQVAVSDSGDIETKCVDPHIRRKIQRDRHLLSQAAVWGLRPTCNPFWNDTDHRGLCLDSMEDVFLLLERLPSVSSFYGTMFDCNQVQSWYGRNSDLSKIGTVHLETRFYHHTDVEWSFDKAAGIARTLENLMQVLSSFSGLRFVTLDYVYVDPGPEFNEPYGRLYREYIEGDNSDDLLDENDGQGSGSDDDSDNGDGEDANISSRGRRLSQIDGKFHDLPTGFERQHLDALEAELNLGLVKLPELREFTLNNISLNVQSLLGWLADQPQLPHDGMVLRLCGHNILYGFNPRTFLQLLSVLNVRLVLDDDDKTLYYETKFTGHATSFYSPAFQVLFGRRTIYLVASFRSNSYYDVDLGSIVWEEESKLLSDVMVLEAMAPNIPLYHCSATFVDRPSDIQKHFQQKIDYHNIWDAEFYYCCLITIVEEKPQKLLVVFQWLDRPTYHQYRHESKKGAATQDPIVLFIARASHGPDEDLGYGFSWEDEQDHLARMSSELERERGEQELLAMYENELLRLDVTT